MQIAVSMLWVLVIMTHVVYVVTAWVALAVPLWLYTMRIHRAPLNYQMMNLIDTKIDSLIDLVVPVYLSTDENLPDVVEATQFITDRQLERVNVTNWRLRILPGVAPNDNSLTITLKSGKENTFLISDYENGAAISYTLDLLEAGRLPEYIASVLLDYVYAPEIRWMEGQTEFSQTVVNYSPAYHISFSLFYGGGEEITWEIDTALKRFEPLREYLSLQVANLTMDSQIEYYATPACSSSWNGTAWVFEQTDLATFVNFAEWCLASSVPYPTLNFVLYVPSPDQSPSFILGSQTNSFIIPQWGGVMILNNEKRNLDELSLSKVIDVFSSQLLTILGLPEEPESLRIRLGTLSRMNTVRGLRGAAAALGSLHRLSDKLPNIAIPTAVLNNSEEAITEFKESVLALKTGDWVTAAHRAGKAFTFAERAFFDKHMVAQTFFPDEHKLAVYMPIVAPVMVVLISAYLRLWSRRMISADLSEKLKEADQNATISLENFRKNVQWKHSKA